MHKERQWKSYVWSFWSCATLPLSLLLRFLVNKTFGKVASPSVCSSLFSSSSSITHWLFFQSFYPFLLHVLLWFPLFPLLLWSFNSRHTKRGVRKGENVFQPFQIKAWALPPKWGRKTLTSVYVFKNEGQSFVYILFSQGAERSTFSSVSHLSSLSLSLHTVCVLSAPYGFITVITTYICLFIHSHRNFLQHSC